ncbi:hypothetical protein, partial [Nonomuraea terrae]|uniref:hypothetical protein n=1 Tax=Nonomuraea terrae TaxID=2530383 RepID=UPI003CCC56D5
PGSVLAGVLAASGLRPGSPRLGTAQRPVVAAPGTVVMPLGGPPPEAVARPERTPPARGLAAATGRGVVVAGTAPTRRLVVIASGSAPAWWLGGVAAQGGPAADGLVAALRRAAPRPVVVTGMPACPRRVTVGTRA